MATVVIISEAKERANTMEDTLKQRPKERERANIMEDMLKQRLKERERVNTMDDMLKQRPQRKWKEQEFILIFTLNSLLEISDRIF
mmetsp:Transcript_28385/g.43682  ORF Transcript_28385/g.43682 Transcript_28385/m.43682 type:complete len:86 (+) Transcript_28385:284-541(+)